MTITMPRSHRPLVLLAAAALASMLAAACITSSTISTVPPEEMGTVQGVVSFIGAPCPPNDPNRQVPPCDGPYAGYVVELRSPDGQRVLGSAGADHEGRYSINVPVGDYLIVVQAGITPDMTKEHRFTVRGGETVMADLVVDTGIR